MTPASAPPGTLVLVGRRQVLGKLVDGPTHARGQRYVDLGGPRPVQMPVARLRLADAEPMTERDSPAGW